MLWLLLPSPTLLSYQELYKLKRIIGPRSISFLFLTVSYFYLRSKEMETVFLTFNQPTFEC